MMGMMGDVMEVFDEVLVMVVFHTVRHVSAEFEDVVEEWEDEEQELDY